MMKFISWIKVVFLLCLVYNVLKQGFGTKEQKQGREIMQNLNHTQYFRVEKEPELQVKDVLKVVFEAMKEKGYNPVNQIVGYIMSGDPTYITNHNNARSLIMKVERDEVVEEILKAYIKNEDWM